MLRTNGLTEALSGRLSEEISLSREREAEQPSSGKTVTLARLWLFGYKRALNHGEKRMGHDRVQGIRRHVLNPRKF
jgi:hypothetical protein